MRRRVPGSTARVVIEAASLATLLWACPYAIQTPLLSEIAGKVKAAESDGVAPTCFVMYDANGATAGSVPMDSTPYERGEVVTVQGNVGKLAKPGHIFGGWNSRSDGTGYTYLTDQTFVIMTGVSLYADWVPDVQRTSPDDPSYMAAVGTSVGISGNYIILGAPGASSTGAAYILRRVGSSSWTTDTKILATDPQAGDLFGKSVAIYGYYAVCGAPSEDTNGDGAGAAYIYTNAGMDFWSPAKTLAPVGHPGDDFGCAVDVGSSFVVIGADGADSVATDAGAMYICTRSGMLGWGPASTKFVPPTPAAYAHFGRSVATSGSYIVAGSDSESVSVFHFTDESVGWDDGVCLTSPDGQPGDHFGYSVDMSGDYLIVGANGADGAGAAYIFHRVGANAWDAGTKVTPPPLAGVQGFGGSVAMDDEYAIVGAIEGTGSVYIFHRTGTNAWSDGVKVSAADPTQSYGFGAATSIDGNFAVVGASGEDTGAENAGAAHIIGSVLPPS